MPFFRRRPLARELAVILAIKLVLIITIKLLFFSSPVNPGSAGTAQALLNQPGSAVPHD